MKRRRSTCSLACIGIALMVSILPTDVCAQVVAGSVQDFDTNRGIAAADIILLSQDSVELARATTNGEGQFRITVPGAGTYFLRGERIGYAETTTDSITVTTSDFLTVDFTLSATAVPLDAIEVTVLSRPWWEYERPEAVWGFYERMDRYGKFGFGRFLEAADLARQRSSPSWMILSNQLGFGIELVSQRRGSMERSIEVDECRPVYFVDGLPFRADDITVFSTIDHLNQQGRIEGIETYSWKQYVPSEFFLYLSSRDCGSVIAIWTKAP